MALVTFRVLDMFLPCGNWPPRCTGQVERTPVITETARAHGSELRYPQSRGRRFRNISLQGAGLSTQTPKSLKNEETSLTLQQRPVSQL